MENLDIDVLAGTLFMEANNMAVRPLKGMSYLEMVQPLSIAHPLTHVRQHIGGRRVLSPQRQPYRLNLILGQNDLNLARLICNFFESGIYEHK